jgi:hypothetical protein
MNRYLIVFSLLAFGPILSFAQSANVPVNRDYYHLLERYEIMSGTFSPNFHSHVKPYQRSAVGRFLDTLYNNPQFVSTMSGQDRFNMQYLATDTWEWTESDTSR